MLNTEQATNHNMLDHGISCYQRFKDLHDHFKKLKPLQLHWELPEWIYSEAIWNNLLNFNTISIYLLFHDCGKPDCLEIDSTGKRHFPNHADVSARTIAELTECTQLERLVKNDMVIHTIKPDDCNEFSTNSDCITHLVTGLCEIHANAEMFGGFESESFKIKLKRLNQRAKKILKEFE